MEVLKLYLNSALFTINEYWEDPFTYSVFRHVVFASIVIFFIALPNFVCKTSDEDFAKFKEKFKKE